MEKQYRLKIKKDFNVVFKTGKKLSSKNFFIYYIPNNKDHIRIGIATSRKGFTAPQRNKQKRQIRIIVNEAQPWNKAYDVVILSKQTFLKENFAKKQEELIKLFNKLN